MLWQTKTKHKKEYTILISSWLIGIVLLITYIPRNKVKQSTVGFLFHQVLTWLFGLLVVEKGLIKYPVRLFKKAHKTSFTFEYFVFPALSALFNVRFPEKVNWFYKAVYYFCYPTIITLLEVYAEKRTKLIEYIKWNSIYSFITMFLSFYVSRRFYLWFFPQEESDADVDLKC